MEKKKQIRSQRDLQYKKTRNTDKVSEVQNVEKPIKRGVGRPKKQGTSTLGQPYMKVIYVSGNYTEEVEFSPDKPLQGTSYFTSPSDWTARAVWYMLGILSGGFLMYFMIRLIIWGVL